MLKVFLFFLSSKLILIKLPMHITVNLEEIYLQSVLHREKKPEAEEHFSRYLEAASKGQNDLEPGT